MQDSHAPSTSTAVHGAEDDDLSAVDARRLLAQQEVTPERQASVLPVEAHKDGLTKKHYDGVTALDISSKIYGVINTADKTRKQEEREELEALGMTTTNHLQTLLIVLHDTDGKDSANFVMELAASSSYMQLRDAVEARLRRGNTRMRLTWLDEGEEVELDYLTWKDYVRRRWCVQPWEIHAHDASRKQASLGLDEYQWVKHTAKTIFARYDVNRNGRIEKRELRRVLDDLHLERFDCSPALINRWVKGEFRRLDGISLKEFTSYIASMSAWMREELLVATNEAKVFALLAGRATEATMPPAALPGASREPVTTFETGCFGIRLEVPGDALEHGGAAKVSVQTLFRGSVSYLSEGVTTLFPHDTTTTKPQGWLPHTPIVRVDYPAFEGSAEPPELGAAPLPHFRKPLTLVMPHSFDPRAGVSSLVICGAPHGALKWEAINVDEATGDLQKDKVQLDKGEVRVSIPYAGTFCAFTRNSNALLDSDVCAARFYVFAMAEVPCKKASSMRVHLCPEVPDQVEEMEFYESSDWGLATCVGASQLLYLVKGVRFRLRYRGQEEEIDWAGIRTSKGFTLPAAGSGLDPPTDDPDQRPVLVGDVVIDMLPGRDKKSSNTRACAQRAGIPEKDWRMPFTTRLKGQVRPNPPAIALRERTPYDFTVAWQQPKLVGGSKITHYEIQLATTAPNGNPYPWRALWYGAGHECPDFRLALAKRLGDTVAVERLQKEARELSERLQRESKEAGKEKQSGSLEKKATNKKKPKRKADGAAGSSSGGMGAGAGDERFYSYTLPVDSGLFGRLRIRCWAEDEERPSPFSKPITLPRWMGKVEEAKDAQQAMLDDARAEYFGALTQHVTTGNPVMHRIGNSPSTNTWCGDAPPPPPEPTAKERAMGNVMAPVPYDVPLLPPKRERVDHAAEVLARFFRKRGVNGGGGGSLFGLTIDHVLHAIHGTPTVDGGYSPPRTSAGLGEPLIALCEVAYADALLPLFDDAAVVRAQWDFIDEKVYGVVDRVAAYREHYEVCAPYVEQILIVMLEIHEMARSSQPDCAITFHLSNVDYSKEVRKHLKRDITTHMRRVAWRLSTELLAMQLEVRQRGGEPLAYENQRKIRDGSSSYHTSAMTNVMKISGKIGRVHSLLMHSILVQRDAAQVRAKEYIERAAAAMAMALKAGRTLRHAKALRLMTEAAEQVAAVKLQACARGLRGRKRAHRQERRLKARQKAREDHAAAVRLQARERGRCARRKCTAARHAFVLLKAAATSKAAASQAARNAAALAAVDAQWGRVRGATETVAVSQSMLPRGMQSWQPSQSGGDTDFAATIDEYTRLAVDFAERRAKETDARLSVLEASLHHMEDASGLTPIVRDRRRAVHRREKAGASITRLDAQRSASSTPLLPPFAGQQRSSLASRPRTPAKGVPPGRAPMPWLASSSPTNGGGAATPTKLELDEALWAGPPPRPSRIWITLCDGRKVYVKE